MTLLPGAVPARPGLPGAGGEGDDCGPEHWARAGQPAVE
jgi:hypothetical protein